MSSYFFPKPFQHKETFELSLPVPGLYPCPRKKLQGAWNSSVELCMYILTHTGSS